MIRASIKSYNFMSDRHITPCVGKPRSLHGVACSSSGPACETSGNYLYEGVESDYPVDILQALSPFPIQVIQSNPVLFQNSAG